MLRLYVLLHLLLVRRGHDSPHRSGSGRGPARRGPVEHARQIAAVGMAQRGHARRRVRIELRKTHALSLAALHVSAAGRVRVGRHEQRELEQIEQVHFQQVHLLRVDASKRGVESILEKLVVVELGSQENAGDEQLYLKEPEH